MKKFLLTIITFILFSGLSFSQQVDMRLTLEDNTHNFPNENEGEIIINVWAVSRNGEAQINLFEGAFQLDANLMSQYLSADFSFQHFTKGIFNYSYTEDYSAADGRIRYRYERSSLGAFETIPNIWERIVAIKIRYTMTNASSSINWYANLFTVLNQSGQSIQGIRESIPSELSNIPLPVELSSFSANLKGENVELKWRTETEVDNFGFEVQRLQDSEWERIGFVEGNGNSNSPKNYSFTDKNFVGGSKFVYRLKQIDNNGTFAYSNEVEVDIIPGSYELFQNYPNPFNPVTNIKFSLPENSNVRLDVYNIIGELITTLLNKNMEAGFYIIPFDASNLPSGTYIYRIDTKGFSQTKKMLVLR